MAAAELSALRAGDEVAGVFACTRKDRLLARTGTPVPGARAARPHARAARARVPRRRPARRPLRPRRPRARAAAASSASATSCRSRSRAIERAADADPAAFLPVAYRDLDELDGFLEHLAREVHEPGYRALLEGLLGDAALRAEWRRAPCTRGGHHAYLGGLLEHTVAVGDARARDLPAAPAAELRPAADRRARARPRQDARVHLRRRDRRCRTEGACSATSCSASSCSSRAWPRWRPSAASRSCTACSATTGRTPRPAAASARPRRSRCTASTRSTRASRARSSTASRARVAARAARRRGSRAS